MTNFSSLFAMYPWLSETPCCEGGPSVDMPLVSGGWANIFTSLQIECAGKVTSWEFYASNTGTFFAGIWRPTGANKFLFVGANMITVTVTGAQVED